MTRVPAPDAKTHTARPFQLAARLDQIEPFYTMELIKRAMAMEARGRSIIHMSIGEPDFTAPEPVLAALTEAMAAGHSGYTPAVGIAPLREAIAAHYRRVFGLEIGPQRIVVTAGASAALLLAAVALLDAGQEVLMPDPSYPCNRHILAAVDALARLVPSGTDQRFQLDAGDVRRHWGPATRGVLLASPSNPTGTTIAPDALDAVLHEVRARQGFLIVDEIYQMLCYGHAPRSALALGDDVVVVNSFSKYFCMTGWRLGWLVLPEALVAQVEKVAQNLYICPSAPAQHAALACFTPAALSVYEQRRLEFQARRDFLVPALRELGFGVPVEPDGAFYVYADASGFGRSSDALASHLLEQAGVCVVPGRDFGSNEPGRWLRLSYATALPRLHEAVERMRAALAHR